MVPVGMDAVRIIIRTHGMGLAGWLSSRRGEAPGRGAESSKRRVAEAQVRNALIEPPVMYTISGHSCSVYVLDSSAYLH